MLKLQTYQIANYTTVKDVHYQKVDVSYQLFGCALHTAPIVLVNHALTGNSNVTGVDGWWKTIVGDQKVINTSQYTVLAIDIPGNGFNDILIEDYKDFIIKDIAMLFLKLIKHLKIEYLHAIIGSSIGGGIAWELAVIAPHLSRYIIPIASSWKSSDWIIAHSFVQQNILNYSNQPLEIARQMAMLFYRTPQAIQDKFKHQYDANNVYKVESWLNYHGKVLADRFQLDAYKMMNHLLATIDITRTSSFKEVVQPITSEIIQIGIDTDLFFLAGDSIKTRDLLNNIAVKNQYFEIVSIHGHDAFLIEHEQLTNILKHFF